MKIRTIAGIIVLIVSGASLGHAQISPFSGLFELTRGDLDAIGAVLNPILDDANAAPGSAAKWSNQKSGASGSVKLLETLDLGEYQGCKKIQYDMKIRGSADPKKVVIAYCKVEDGSWKTYP